MTAFWPVSVNLCFRCAIFLCNVWMLFSLLFANQKELIFRVVCFTCCTRNSYLLNTCFYTCIFLEDDWLILRIIFCSFSKLLACSLCFLAHLSMKCSVSFCHPSMSGVRRPSSVRPSVRASVNNFFKRHLLWNHLLDFDQISQEWSLGGPLSKLFKPFQLVA